MTPMNSSINTVNQFNYTYPCERYAVAVFTYGHIIPAIFLFIFGLTFNLIALYYFHSSHHFHRTAYCYYFSTIALFDSIRLVVWCVFLFIDFKVLKMAFKRFECSTQMFIESVTSGVSVWITAALTIERCAVIFKSMKCRQRRGQRAIICIISIISFSILINLLFLKPGYYRERLYNNRTINILCLYGTDDLIGGNSSIITDQIKFYYTLSIVVFRTVIPFFLLLLANIALFICLRKYRTTRSISHYSFVSSRPKQRPLAMINNGQELKDFHSHYTLSAMSNPKNGSQELIKHGRSRRVTPMIFLSSLILIITVSPR
ncbi:unnamed protein product [Didymodactylos carnosus]|uniref:G-protein coupled receptors family 1 profile domain-containing protein n=1 Tax=Didymodactylos carnosus TaxID=1234261 RepID=A0A816D5Y9_9BILA|nr:unnamed protein product [Didymodactylos carnosus]CAF4537058.1 unnamed protein product [Didymodactylos carnosus]